MPIRNVGTLLENLVIMEAARLLLRQAQGSCRFEFFNSFAMPPLTPWTGDANPSNFSTDIFGRLSEEEGADGQVWDYADLLRRCLHHDQGGPSGAVLVAMLASLAGLPARMWLNDLQDDSDQAHYPNAITGLQGLPELVATLLPGSAALPTVTVCDQAYPDSLEHMAVTVSAWNAIRVPRVRLGFLDPLKYSVSNCEYNYTSSDDHRHWLRSLGTGNCQAVMSVHFTSSRHAPVLSHELVMMGRDGVEAGFPVSLEVRHGSYVVVVAVRATSVAASRALATALEQAVCSAWVSWHQVAATHARPLSSTMRVQLVQSQSTSASIGAGAGGPPTGQPPGDQEDDEVRRRAVLGEILTFAGRAAQGPVPMATAAVAGGPPRRDVWEPGWEQRPGDPLPGGLRAVRLTSAIDMTFAWIPPGRFRMGSPQGEAGHQGNEPQYDETLINGYWLAVHPVTQAQWSSVLGSNPSHFSGTGAGKEQVKGLDTDDFPVENVSWVDCNRLVARLGQMTGLRFSLPTEVQWEYACRAGTTTPFHFSEPISTDLANYDATYPRTQPWSEYNRHMGRSLNRTCKVGSYRPNAWGLYDMHGNVMEWCQDWHGEYPQRSDRCLRGGAWWQYPWLCRSAYRRRSRFDVADKEFGCRLVLCG